MPRRRRFRHRTRVQPRRCARALEMGAYNADYYAKMFPVRSEADFDAYYIDI